MVQVVLSISVLVVQQPWIPQREPRRLQPCAVAAGLQSRDTGTPLQPLLFQWPSSEGQRLLCISVCFSLWLHLSKPFWLSRALGTEMDNKQPKLGKGGGTLILELETQV